MKNNPLLMIDPLGLEGVGHHWVPIWVVTDPEIRKKLSDEAFEAALGATSGATEPSHGNKTYGGVKHWDYNKLVKKELEEYLTKNNIKKMTGEQMLDFAKNISEGIGHKGKVHDDIKAFNDAIRAERDAFFKKQGLTAKDCPELTLDAARKRGKSLIQSRKLFNLAVGAVLAQWAAGALNEVQGAMEVAGESKNFRNGVGALANGDLAGAERWFFGRANEMRLGGFFGELNAKGFSKAALNFQKHYDEALEKAQKQFKEYEK